ncbi:chaoptin [Schistocerca nitens]|uniref:chaoptin n=1 Tax=Schistocerca nitens TaxID=7011 RepID=UPI002117AE98|nr:chaoptin [Schistocerca nitens]
MPLNADLSLGAVLRFGYAMVALSLVLMVWASLAGARESGAAHHHHYSAPAAAHSYPPCYFNPLCSCSKAVPDLGIVACRGVPLPRVPPPLNASKLFTLHLSRNGLRGLEPYFLQGTGLYGLEITHNALAEIPDEAFMGLERSMWELDLSDNELTAVPSRALRHLQKLRRLDLSGNDISEVNQEAWRGLEESLQTLDLADNSLTSLPPAAFSNLQLLEALDLQGNHLSELDVALFRDGPPRLSRLQLADNQLSSVPYRQLAPLRLLRTLDLSVNRIAGLHSATSEPDEARGSLMSLDTLRLERNQIQYLPPGAFQHFDVLNRTFLDGNPLVLVQGDAFRDAKIRELSLRDCGLSELSARAFSGLEATLQALDLSANNLTELPQQLFHEFDFLRTLSLRDNSISQVRPAETLTGFQYSLYRLDLTGRDMGITAIQDLRRMRNLRSLSLSRLPQPHLAPDDFLEFGVDLEEVRVVRGNLRTIKNHAFMHARAVRRLDLSENAISLIEPDAFTEIGHSLTWLRMAHGLASSVGTLPHEALRPLVNLESLDMSNNRLRTMPETSFHFLRRLRVLQLQDNQIEHVPKGTFQGNIHSGLEEVYLSLNSLSAVNTHTFVDLSSLETLRLDDNRIERVERRAFMNLDRLKMLDLRGNRLTRISDEAFQNLPELEELDLAYNRLTSLDFTMLDQVGTLATFRLNASHNRLHSLESNSSAGLLLGHRGDPVAVHSNIKVLDLSHNNVSGVARGYFRPVETSLTHLYLSHNLLSNASRDLFGNMPHLQWLDLSHNELVEIDFDTFRNTRRLQVLMLSHNLLLDVPAELFRAMSDLRVVDLSHNRLRALPDSLFLEPGLERLSVAGNALSRVPLSAMGLQAAATLVELDLSRNTITTLHGHDVFARFKSLARLDLSHNRLVRVEDATFSTLARLSSLDLSHNPELLLDSRGRCFQGLEDSLLELGLENVSLSSMPDLALSSLQTLRLSNNILTTLPSDLAANMSHLRHLELAHNALQAVPPAAHALPHLRRLVLAGNPISTISNTSLLGAADKLTELDLTELPLNYFESGALGQMTSLRTLHVSPYRNVRQFNLPHLLQYNYGLKELHIHVYEETGLRDEMSGPLPFKLSNITVTGRALKTLPDDLLMGVRSPRLHFGLHNTSVSAVQAALFQRATWVRNLTLDVRNNSLRSLSNPNRAEFPGVPRKMFLNDLRLAHNLWDCNCQLGWVEVWQRKRHQYLCEDKSSQETDCYGTSDDVRTATCANRGNVSLADVLKTDIECGWGSAAPNAPQAPAVVAAVMVAVMASLLG